MAQSHATMMAPQPTMMFMQSMQERNRKCANTVAIVDTVLGILNLLACILEGILAYFKNQLDKEKIQNAALSEKRSQELIQLADTDMYVRISIDVIEIFISGVWIWLALGLLTATNIATPPDQSLRKAKWWRGFHIFVIIIKLIFAVVIYLLDSPLFTWHVICILVLGLLTFFVHKFIQDLQRVGGAPMMMGGGNPIPTSFTSTQYSLNQQQPNNQNQNQP